MKDGDRQHLSDSNHQCTARVLDLVGQIESVTRWSNIFLVVGATLAGLGSTCAGTLSAKTSQKVAAVAGAFGAIVAVLPKTLQKQDHINQTMVHADAHRNLGKKVFNQLPYTDQEPPQTTIFRPNDDALLAVKPQIE